MKWIHVVNWLSAVFAITVIGLSVAFAWAVLSPVDVLKDWHLTVPQSSYRAGADVDVLSTFIKTRSVSGTSYRFLECFNTNQSLSRYPIDQVDSNKPARAGSAIVALKLPDNLPNLPVSCHINITVVYNIHSFRKVTETNVTNNFQVVK